MADAAVVKHKMDRAKTQLVIKYPFFATLVLKYPLVETPAVPTMGVDPKGKIYYNPNFVAGLSEGQIIFGLAHEAMHRVGLHVFRKGARNHQKWNYATDAWINDTLRTAGVGEWIPGIVDMPGSKDQTSEHIYAQLPNMPEYDMGDLGGDLMPGDQGPLDEETERKLQHEAKRDLAEAATVARMRGNLPDNLRRYVDSVLNVKVPWFKLLERWMTAKTRVHQSWARPNRRFRQARVYMPSYDSQNAMGPMACIIDTSGSIGDKELAEFGGHVKQIVEQVRPTKIYIVYVDSVVNHVDEFTADDMEITLKPHGGGGTDMRQGFEWLRKNAPDLEACIVLSDLYTPFPDTQYFPTIWASTTDQVAPAVAGQTIYIGE